MCGDPGLDEGAVHILSALCGPTGGRHQRLAAVIRNQRVGVHHQEGVDNVRRAFFTQIVQQGSVVPVR